MTINIQFIWLLMILTLCFQSRVCYDVQYGGSVDVRPNEVLVFCGTQNRLLSQDMCFDNDCKINIKEAVTNPNGGKKVHYHIGFYYIPPAMVGYMWLCAVNKDYTEKSFSYARKRRIGHKRLLLPQFLLNPIGVDITFYTWFMDQKQYHELQTHRTTKHIVPVTSEKRNKDFYIYGSATSQETVSCTVDHFKRRTKGGKLFLVKRLKILYLDGYKFHTKDKKGHLFGYVFAVKFTSHESNSGTYILKCVARYMFSFDMSHHQARDSINLELQFVKDPTIIAPSEVVYQIEDKAGEIDITVATTCKIASFHFERSDGEPIDSRIVTNFVYLRPLKAKYTVNFPWLKREHTGVYKITVTNVRKRSATSSIKIFVSEKLKVAISPLELKVGEYSENVIFYCTVSGGYIQDMYWEPSEFRSLRHRTSQKDTGKKGTKALSLTFPLVNKNYTGAYTCVARGKYWKHVSEATTKLLVLPLGSSEIDPKYQTHPKHRQDIQVNVDEQTEAPKEENILNKLIPGASMVGGVLVLLCAGAIVVAVIFMRRMGRRERKPPLKKSKKEQRRVKRLAVLSRESFFNESDSELNWTISEERLDSFKAEMTTVRRRQIPGQELAKSLKGSSTGSGSNWTASN